MSEVTITIDRETAFLLIMVATKAEDKTAKEQEAVNYLGEIFMKVLDADTD